MHRLIWGIFVCAASFKTNRFIFCVREVIYEAFLLLQWKSWWYEYQLYLVYKYGVNPYSDMPKKFKDTQQLFPPYTVNPLYNNTHNNIKILYKVFLISMQWTYCSWSVFFITAKSVYVGIFWNKWCRWKEGPQYFRTQEPKLPPRWEKKSNTMCKTDFFVYWKKILLERLYQKLVTFESRI